MQQRCSEPWGAANYHDNKLLITSNATNCALHPPRPSSKASVSNCLINNPFRWLADLNGATQVGKRLKGNVGRWHALPQKTVPLLIVKADP